MAFVSACRMNENSSFFFFLQITLPYKVSENEEAHHSVQKKFSSTLSFAIYVRAADLISQANFSVRINNKSGFGKETTAKILPIP
jgi:hypothetical protein